MRAQLIAAALALSVMGSVGLVQARQGGSADRHATVGQAASGQVISEAGGILRLNTTPCRDTPSVMVFRQPYAKEAAGEVNCKGSRRSLVQVIKK
jgi:hypothetical protein